MRKMMKQVGLLSMILVSAIDLYTLLADSPAMFPDNVHPTADGAAVIASQIHKVLVRR